MATNLGDLKLSILLDVVPLNESIKTSLNLLKMFSANADAALKLKPPTFSTSEFDAELRKLDTTLQSHQTEIEQTVIAEKQLEVQQERTSTSTVRMAGMMENAFLRVQGFQSVIMALKSTFGDLLTAYQEQEVANSKLLNNLKNTGQGMDEFRTLTKQASDLQKTTVYGDEQIINGQAMLATFKKSAEEIAILTPRALDLSAAFDQSGEGGKSLQEVMVMLGKVNEETIGTLRRVGVAFDSEQEAKLKSLKGTEQAIFLAEILDSNFKGLAETVGQTSAGQMKIFQNSVGEIKESLGQFIAEGLAPTVSYLKVLTDGSAGMSNFFKVLILGAMAAAAAFVILGTSMGGIPYIVLGVITVVTALSSAFGVNTAAIEANKQAMLESQNVSESMKKTLDDLGVSAANMSEAYKNISASIMTMTRVQLDSAQQFVDAEISKIEAIRETGKALRQQELMKMDIGFADAKNRSKMEADQFIDLSEFGANLDKLKEIKTQIDAKRKFTLDDDTAPGRVGKSSTTNTAERETDAVKQLTDTWNKQIEVYYTAAKYQQLFTTEGKSLVDVYSQINAELSKTGVYTEEQALSLIKFRDTVLDMMQQTGYSIRNLITGGLQNDDPEQLARQFMKERMDWYNEYGSKDKRFKPLNEATEYVNAIKLIKEIRGETLGLVDLQNFSNSLKEKANTMDVSTEANARQQLSLLKEAKSLDEEILKIRKSAYNALYEASRSSIDLMENEFQRKRAFLELEHQKKMNDFDIELKHARSETEKNAIRQSQNALRGTTQRQREQLEEDEISTQASRFEEAFSGTLSNAQIIARLFGKAGDPIVEAFQRALNIAQGIKAIFDTIALIKGIVSLFSGGVGGALPAFHTGGIIGGTGEFPILAEGGEGIISRGNMQRLSSTFGPGFFAWLNGSSSPTRAGIYHQGGVVSSAARSSSVREVPYIATTEVTGTNLKLVLTRQNKIDSNRSNG